jgi:hypothetical protein
MLSRCLTLVLVTVLASQAFAQTAFAPVADKIRAEPLALPAAAEVVTLTPADPDTPRQDFSLKRTFAADGTFTTDWTSPRFTWHERFRADGTLVSSLQTDGLKGLVLEQTTNPGRTSLRTVITEKGQVKSDKTAELTPGTVLRDEMTHLVAQAWWYGVRDGLTFRSLSPDGAMAGDFLIQFRTVNDPASMSSKYAYPDEFKAAVAAPGPYLVADMSLQGIAAVFVPYHFYLVYAVTGSGVEWRAYFGEDPKKPVYRFLKR